MNGHCIDCGKILRGRSDKRFCDDYCRNHHYNQLHRDDNSFLRLVNKILKKNQRILKNLHTESKFRVSGQLLLELGFDFRYATHQANADSAEPCICCYEYGYLKLSEEDYRIAKMDYSTIIPQQR